MVLQAYWDQDSGIYPVIFPVSRNSANREWGTSWLGFSRLGVLQGFFMLQGFLMFKLLGHFFRWVAEKTVDQVADGHHDASDQDQQRRVMREHVLGPGDDLRTEDYRKDGQHAETQQTAAEDSQKKLRDLHFKHACRKNEELERRRRRQHGGDHQGEKLLALKAVADALEFGFVDALQQKQFAAGPAQSVGNQAANG